MYVYEDGFLCIMYRINSRKYKFQHLVDNFPENHLFSTAILVHPCLPQHTYNRAGVASAEDKESNKNELSFRGVPPKVSCRWI